jgi:hypothetical protein
VNLVMTGVVAGVLGTVAMDALNFLFARTGVLTQIEVRMIGRMAAGWTRGRFRYRHPSQMRQIEHELLFGYLTHYAIGVGLAVPFVIGWDLLVGGPVSPGWTIVYGVATTVASHFFVLPCMGFGVFGRHAPEGMKLALSSLANHLFFGLGMAAGIALT